ncbi:pyridoxamine 5'-phosphate oxidase family protein [Actinophytocola oryzae]|uniref:Nitroimidazol reductase NimA-like FMN-containing flavoprotein (Pyridoxamine 5'-phosphate oxidase superfamily) n=1 Tax=Actinophytocola oryzae TaxID=502181 RepID=A0A4R7UUL6_9PSEU|nr:pyridoxamine 5'-phosphate oxidase family protein [Actinophytocola oryzae]TDV39704.1 nitroimidazol reductase NimA-like FMN-containing flavoprotein (pyridoxamine 5'-phosphate oxidase superfamily) [Actinophytocola oryzae]
MDEPRTRERRRADTLHRLTEDVDAWVATAGGDVPCLVPLSFHWDGTALYLSTLDTNPTARNIVANGRVRLTLGETRDVVLVEGVASVVDPPADVAEAFATRTGFDPRKLPRYPFFRVEPRLVQAWREVNEIADRDLMRDGVWI